MREIKFRAWDKVAIPARMKTWEQLLAQYELTHVFMAESEYFELMQYTGLKDKNGNGIYEGDIIEDGYLNPMTNNFVSKKYAIGYKNGCFYGKLIGKSPFGDTWLTFIHGEIIGNIFENPELMEVQHE